MPVVRQRGPEVPKEIAPDSRDDSRNRQGRDPDFLILGAMKAGTSSLFRWLDSVGDVELPGQKELNFFSGSTWDRGIEWYRSQFPAHAVVTGEASPSYSSPSLAGDSARRIFDMYPDMKLIFVARHPEERARSHYRHQVQRGRERRLFHEAMTIDSIYVQTSLYSRTTAPYFERFPRSQILVVRFEELTQTSEAGWRQVLDFLELPNIKRPLDAVNQTVGKRGFSGPLLQAWERGWTGPAKKMPRFVRSAGKALLTSDSKRYRALMVSSEDDLPMPALTELQADGERFETLIGQHT